MSRMGCITLRLKICIPLQFYSTYVYNDQDNPSTTFTEFSGSSEYRQISSPITDKSKMPSVLSIPYQTACVSSGSATKARKSTATGIMSRINGNPAKREIIASRIPVPQIAAPADLSREPFYHTLAKTFSFPTADSNEYSAPKLNDLVS